MQSPPLLGDALSRVIKLSRLNGWSVAIFAGLCAVGSLAYGDFLGALVGLLVTFGGALEVQGHRMLKRNDAGGMRWLVRSQLIVLAVIWAYAISRLLCLNDQVVRETLSSRAGRQLFPRLLGASFDELGITLEDILPLVRLFIHILYGSVLAATLIYQGGLALYYRHCAPAVEAVLKTERPVGSPPLGL
jgi:hypothetical protein